MASSSSVTTTPVKYEVFISFRGEDTREGFSSHLYAALRREKVATFMDTELRRGDVIKQSLLDTIEKSTISVVIFSQGYASSGWCLDELVKIVECKNRPTNSHILLPVFYHVDPTDVRYQSETYRKALEELEEKCRGEEKSEQRFRENVDKWRAALTEAADIAGHNTETTSNEAELVEEIVNNILKRLDHMFLSENKEFIIGVQPSITEVESLLHMGLEEIIRIGIWGMSGIGKTTIARAVFNKIQNQFDDSFFSENVLIDLNERTFRKRKRDKEKNLIVLDDVTLTSIKQKEYLIEDFVNRLGPGSRIIITTRDKEVLKHSNVPCKNIYKVKGLSYPETLQLFSWYAFKKIEPIPNYHDLSKRVVEYAQGVPLVLKECGKFFYKRVDKLDVWASGIDKLDVWASAIDKLQASLLQEIHEKLKISYDELHGTYPKDQFLDIACFFKGQSREFVENYLDANYEFKSTSDLDDLISKCLISITSDKKITVNDVLQVMAWKIVRQQSHDCRERQSRLWYHKDVSYVLRSNAGTEYVKGICLDMSQSTPFKVKGFGKMHDLRFFKVHCSHYEQNSIKKVLVSKDLDFVFTELRYLCWHGCTLASLESYFDAENLVALDMPHSEVKKLWTEKKRFEKLKYINLSHSKHLVESPDFSFFPNLESLILEGCTGLNKISPTIEHLKQLVILSLRHCKSLKSLPRNISKLKSLEQLLLSGCSKLDGLSDDSGEVENIPLSFEHLSKLLHLDIGNCQKLQSLPQLPRSLQSIVAHNCELLEASSSLSIILGTTKESVRINFSSCFNLDQQELQDIIKGVLDDIEKLRCQLRACICFPGTEIPECFKFTHQNNGSSITCKLPQSLWNWCFVSFAVSAIVEFRNYENEGEGLDILYECRDGTAIFYNGSLKSWECEAGPRNVNKDHVFLGYDFLKYDARTSNSDEMSIQFYVKDSNGNCIDACEVKKCGFRLLRSQKMENPVEVEGTVGIEKEQEDELRLVGIEEEQEDELRLKRLKLKLSDCSGHLL